MYSNHTAPKLPIEMLWSIMKWCNFQTSMTIAIMFEFDTQIAYKYHFYSSVIGSNFEIFEHLKSLCVNCLNFKFLMMNAQFIRHYSCNQLLIFAAGMGDIRSIIKYIELGDPSVDNNLAVRLASSHGHTKIVEILVLDQRVDPSDHENYSLKSASQGGFKEIVEILLKDARVDPSASDNFTIGVASILGHVEIVQVLLKHDRLQLPNEFWALRYAFMKGNMVIVDLLCTYLGLDINLWK